MLEFYREINLRTEDTTMLKELLRMITELMARIHNGILAINDGHEFGLNDKQLHLVVIGLLGFGIFIVVQTVFKWLAKRSITAISWIYTFTLVVVITFAIEVGQYGTKTGDMSLGDIAYGIWGFLLMFLVYLIVRGAFRLMRRKRAREAGYRADRRDRGYIGERRY